MRRILILTNAFFLLFLSGCVNHEYQGKALAVIYTSASIPSSELSFLDRNGRTINSIQFKKQGIFEIIPITKDDLVLPVRFSNEIVKLDLEKNEIKEEKTKAFPIFYNKIKDKEFIIFNSDEQNDIDYLTYQIKDGGGISKFLRIKGFPQCVAIDNMKTYIYLDLVEEEKQVITIIDLNEFEIEEQMPVNLGRAGDIIIADNNIFITRLHANEIVKIPLMEKHKITTIKLKFPNPKYILAYKDKILVVHYNGIISLLERDDLEMIGVSHLNRDILKVKLKEDKLYVLSQDNNGGIIIINLNNFEIEKTINLEHKKNLLVQDMVILD